MTDLGAAVAGFEVGEFLKEGPDQVVCRAIRVEDRRPVLLHVLDREAARDARARLWHEYEVLSRLDVDGVVRPLGLLENQGGAVLVLDDPGGDLLAGAIPDEGLGVDQVLDIGTRLAAILGEIHALQVVHRDVNPANIAWRRDGTGVALAGFGLASLIPEQTQSGVVPRELEGTLAYLSPEQTGRMNRVVDYRTDYYSLGATLYHLSTGRPPFQADDAAEMVHCHIARVPQSPAAVRVGLPSCLSRVILKLLAKNAEDRYQSSAGICADLARCRAALAKGVDSDFSLGAGDLPDRFQLPQRIYGREEEIARLAQAFASASHGRKTLVMVAGYAGVGKSRLVREIQKVVAGQRGYFISGKFDQYKRDVPYGALLEAFGELVHELLSEGDERLARWQRELREALGPNGRVIADLIPDVGLILGPQPEVPELLPAELRNRLNIVFQKFIGVFTRAEHPLVLFLDDLQWMDLASMGLLQMLMAGPGTPCLLCVGAYRDNEVGAAHPLSRTLAEIERAGVEIAQINLAPLAAADVQRFVADTIGVPVADAQPLAEKVRHKTGGNPFFLREFLKTLAKEGILSFDRASRRWTYRLEDVDRLGATENVVDLMAAKIRQLDPAAQQALQLGACVGNRFDLPTLANACGRTPTEVMECLRTPVTEGLLLFLDDARLFPTGGYRDLASAPAEALQEVRYKFAHDKIQQAAYSLIPESDRAAVHWQIGHQLLAGIPASRLDAVIFDVVNQLNEGRACVASEEERVQLAELNLRAGRKAKASVAFHSAQGHLGAGLAVFRDAWWDERYALALDLHTEAQEVAYLCTRFDEMERLAAVVLERAKTLFDELRVHEILIRAAIGQNRQQDAVRMALPVMRRLGVSVPEAPGMAAVGLELVRVKAALIGRDRERLLHQAEMTDPALLAAVRIGSAILSASYMVNPNLFPLLALRVLRLSLQHGMTDVSPYVLAVYALLLCGLLGQVEQGHALGELALRLHRRLNDKSLESRLLFALCATVRHYKEHPRDVVPMLRDSVRVGLEVGDFEFSAASAAMHGYFQFLTGRDLASVDAEMRDHGAVIRQIGQDTYRSYNELFHQACRNLQGRSPDPLRLSGDVVDERVVRRDKELANDRHGLAILHILKCYLNLLFGHYRDAVSNADQARPWLDGVLSMLVLENFRFFDALARIAVLREDGLRRGERRAQRSRIAWDRRRLARLARNAPMTYRHKLMLVDAELARLGRKCPQAGALYDEAIQGAAAGGFVQDQALACELAAGCFLDAGRRNVARAYLEDARRAYDRWGATAKVRHLQEMHPDLLGGTRRGMVGGDGASASIDLAAVLKAAQALSGEIHLPRLLQTMMSILQENAGATRGVLVLESDGDFFVEAESRTSPDAIDVLGHQPLRGYPGLPHSVVNFVLQTRETLVLDTAVAEGAFGRDPYFQKRSASSVMCTPLVHQKKLAALVYLENDLTPGAFTPDRVGVLEMLAAQIVVSLENARLYDGLERTNLELDQRVEDRTRQLKEAHASLSREKLKADALLLNILPGRVATNLKERGATEPESFESVTVLLTDFVDFTEVASDLEPKLLIAELNDLFTAFDNIIERNGCERIKTIGDAYLCVCGMPEPNDRHAERILASALEIREYLEQRNRARERQWRVRMGVHSGRVVGGVVGVKKYIYDVFGDTINTVARMEHLSEPMRINVTQATRDLVADGFRFTQRDVIAVKGKGEMRMYFLEGRQAGGASSVQP